MDQGFSALAWMGMPCLVASALHGHVAGDDEGTGGDRVVGVQVTPRVGVRNTRRSAVAVQPHGAGGAERLAQAHRNAVDVDERPSRPALQRDLAVVIHPLVRSVEGAVLLAGHRAVPPILADRARAGPARQRLDALDRDRLAAAAVVDPRPDALDDGVAVERAEGSVADVAGRVAQTGADRVRQTGLPAAVLGGPSVDVVGVDREGAHAAG